MCEERECAAWEDRVGGEKGTEKEWALLQDAKKKLVVKKESVLTGFISAAFSLKITKMSTITLFLLHILLGVPAQII